jgi:cyclase
MLSRRIIPCLDVKNGHVVKGVRFREHQIVGEILDLALTYQNQGADELVFYEISASARMATLELDWVHRLAEVLSIPFCVAGGIRSVESARAVLNAGADKISVNSPALERPALISELAAEFGSQAVVVGVDSRREQDGNYRVFLYSGDETKTKSAAIPTHEWLQEVQARGAGEVVLNCMDYDGTGQGYDLLQLAQARKILSIPLIASGGARSEQHFLDAFEQADVDATLAAGVFHRGELSIANLKRSLARANVPVRL